MHFFIRNVTIEDLKRRVSWLEKEGDKDITELRIEVANLKAEVEGLKAVGKIIDEANARQDAAIQRLITEVGVLTQKMMEVRNGQQIKQ